MESCQKLHVLQILEPGKDGVLRHVEGLCDYLLSQDVKLSLAYSDVRASDRLLPLVRKIEDSGSRTLNLRTGNVPQLRDIRAFLRLLRLCRNELPHILHCHSSKAGALTKGLRLAGVRTPIVYTPNAYFGMGKRPGPAVAFFNGIEHLLGQCGHTINVSSDEARFARDKLGVSASQQSMIYNAIDMQRYTAPSEAERVNARKVFGIPRDAVVVGCIARVSPQKNVDLLYRAIAKAMSKRKDLWLFHVGEGDIAGVAFEPNVAERICRLSYLSDTSTFFHAIDTFAMSSRYEGLSIAVIEALASDCPLILTDVPGNREFLALGLTHVWSAPGGDVEKFTTALLEWVADRPARRHSNHRTIAESTFGYEACYGAVLKIYYSLAHISGSSHTLSASGGPTAK